MGVRIPGGYRYTPADLGLNAVVVPNGATTQGLIVPWRAAFPFDTVVALVRVSAGTPNFVPRITWVDWDGVTIVSSSQPFLNPGSTSADWYYWAKDNTPRALSGAVSTTTLPAILGAPYARLAISNGDAAPATFTMEVALLWSGE